MGSIEQENSVCWVHRGAACVGHRLRGTASVGGPSGNGMCHRGRRAVHQARRTARVGVHRTRGIGQEEQHVVGPSGKKSNFVGPPSGKKSSVWWPIGPLSKREQLAVGPSGKAACVVSIEQAEQRVVGPWTRRTTCVHWARRTACGGSGLARWGGNKVALLAQWAHHMLPFSRFLVSDGPQHALFFLLGGPPLRPR